jgi:hypothetical protein
VAVFLECILDGTEWVLRAETTVFEIADPARCSRSHRHGDDLTDSSEPHHSLGPAQR